MQIYMGYFKPPNIFLFFFYVMAVNFIAIKISNGIVVGGDEVYGDILYII